MRMGVRRTAHNARGSDDCTDPAHLSVLGNGVGSGTCSTASIHHPDGGGYATEIVIYDLLEQGPVSGNIYFFDQSRRPVDPDLR